jgi:protein-disulfide isomerase
MTRIRRLALAALAAPLVLAIAACNSEEKAGAPTGEPIAKIAAPAGTSWVDTAVATPEGGFRIGNPDAPLKLLEFASHTCSHCAEFSQEASAPLDEYVNTGVLSYEIRNLIRDPVDLTIAMLVRCGEPAAFHPLANQAWANFTPLIEGFQANSAALDQASQAPQGQRFQAIAEAGGLIDFFAARGISRDQAMQCLANTDKAQQIAQLSDQQSTELNLTGTPTFFLNGKQLEGGTWKDIQPQLQAAGAR